MLWEKLLNQISLTDEIKHNTLVVKKHIFKS